MWRLRWHFTNKYVAGHLAVLKVTVTVCHTAKHYGEEYDDWNSAVLRSRRNCSNDGAERTDDGRAFHAPAAVTEKARSPSVVRRVVGMTSADVEALRRRRREPTSAVERRVSVRYDGAVPVRQRYARTHNFKFGTLTCHSKSHPADEKSSLKGAWSGSREQFLHCGLRKFRYSKSSVYRWYPQHVRGRFVNDTYKTMKATRMRYC